MPFVANQRVIVHRPSAALVNRVTGDIVERIRPDGMVVTSENGTWNANGTRTGQPDWRLYESESVQAIEVTATHKIDLEIVEIIRSVNAANADSRLSRLYIEAVGPRIADIVTTFENNMGTTFTAAQRDAYRILLRQVIRIAVAVAQAARV